MIFLIIFYTFSLYITIIFLVSNRNFIKERSITYGRILYTIIYIYIRIFLDKSFFIG